MPRRRFKHVKLDTSSEQIRNTDVVLKQVLRQLHPKLSRVISLLKSTVTAPLYN
ncbi:hypothetical protein K7432_017472 [Basidiobolus ranarum]|uniref:Uncharacterized protein n=1 Tax=Basidiobolus ranarum TaxID=34480 RepID=A0ABR2VKB6_9FUNG